MAEHEVSCRADARASLSTSSTTRRAALASLAAAAAVPAAAGALAAPGVSGATSDTERRLLELLSDVRELRVHIETAAAAASRAEQALFDASAAHPYPPVSAADEPIFNFAVQPEYEWTPARLGYFDKPLFRCETPLDYTDAERKRAELRKARMAELAPLVAAVTETLRPFEEAFATAQAAYEALLDRESNIVDESADIPADTIRGIAAKAAILAHFDGVLQFEADDPDERARASILRDLLAMGGAHV